MGKQLLTLVRHGKSSWQTAGQTDFDRPLNDRGRADAPVMASRLVKAGCIPDLILCSAAARTQQTAALMAEGMSLSVDKILPYNELYLAAPPTLLLALQAAASEYDHVMIIAHNPGLEDLSALLSSQCDNAMPTLGIRHFSYDAGYDPISWISGLEDDMQGAASSPDQEALESQTASGAESIKTARVELVFEDYPKNI